MMSRKIVLIVTALYLLCLGVGTMGLTPPFEGVDETAHFSLIKQVASEGRYPSFDKATMDQAVAAYAKNAPMPYPKPLTDTEEGMTTYPSFFGDAEAVQTYRALYRTPRAAPVDYVPDRDANWMIQHPPLYYFLMAPVMNATHGLSFVGQMFALRFVSFAMALAGLLIGVWGTLRYAGEPHEKALLLALFLYPVLAPQFVPEFARIGNDSLCLLLMGTAWLFLLQWLRDEKRNGPLLALGVALGLGLLTKAFFLPVVGGLGVFMLIRLWQARGQPAMRGLRFDQMILLAFPLLLGSSWMIYQWVATGVPLAHPEYRIALNHGGLVGALLARGGPEGLFHHAVSMVMSWSWAGPSSLARLSAPVHLALLIAPMWLSFWGFMVALRKPIGHVLWLIVWVMVLFKLGLWHHMLLLAGLGDMGATPAWYLHILAPMLILWFAYALEGMMKSRRALMVFGALLAYHLLFMVAVMGADGAVLSGFATLAEKRQIVMPDASLALTLAPQMMERLAVLGWPYAGVVVYLLGLVIWAGCAFYWLKAVVRRPSVG